MRHLQEAPDYDRVNLRSRGDLSAHGVYEVPIDGIECRNADDVELVCGRGGSYFMGRSEPARRAENRISRK